MAPRIFKDEVDAFLHVCHFSPKYNKTYKEINVRVWYETGEVQVIVAANTRDGLITAFHFTAEFKMKAPIAYVQVYKTQQVFGLFDNPDVFIRYCLVKRKSDSHANADDNPCKGKVFAFFSFRGFLRDRAIAIKNPTYTPPANSPEAITLETIRNFADNKDLIVEDRLFPRLNWAEDFIVYRTFQQKLRTFVQVGGFASLFQTNSWSMLVNYALLFFKQDTNRYIGIPASAAFPTPDSSFGEDKGLVFLAKNMGEEPKSAAVAFVNSNPKFFENPYTWWPFRNIQSWPFRKPMGHVFSQVNFCTFLEKERRSDQDADEREVAAMAHIVAHHKRDEEFGRLFLESLFCTQIKRAWDKRPTTEHPDIVATPDWVKPLAEECDKYVASKELFYLDFSGLVGIPVNPIGHLHAARVVLQLFDANDKEEEDNEYQEEDEEDDETAPPPKANGKPSALSKSSKKLKPIGIALYSTETGEWRTHLPSHTTWAIAKLFAKLAAGQDHEIVQHALNTHIVLEPFAVALEKRVPLDHFVYRLLKQHFRYTIDVNFKARAALISAGGLFDKFIATGGPENGHIKYMAQEYQGWSKRSLSFIACMKQRGFDQLNVDEELDVNSEKFPLPGYLYAQDAFYLWKYIHAYVEDLAMIQYPAPQDFLDDIVARNFFMEAQTNGFPTREDIVPRDREEFIEICTGLIFTASAEHSAVNFPQFAHYSYVENSPLLLTKPAPLPNTVGEGKVEWYLPRKEQALQAIAAVWGLSRFTRGDERYMYYSDVAFFNLSFWNDVKFHPVCEALQINMGKSEKQILKRKRSAYGTHYLWLLPSKMPTSVAT